MLVAVTAAGCRRLFCTVTLQVDRPAPLGWWPGCTSGQRGHDALLAEERDRQVQVAAAAELSRLTWPKYWPSGRPPAVIGDGQRLRLAGRPANIVGLTVILAPFGGGADVA